MRKKYFQVELENKDIINCLSNAAYLNPATATPQLLHGMSPSIPGNLDPNTGGGIATVAPNTMPGPDGKPMSKSLNQISNELNSILSQYHFIENNDADK